MDVTRPANASRQGVLSQGRYGARVGLPKILDVRAEAEVKSTFFIPGWTVESHQDRAEMVLKAAME